MTWNMPPIRVHWGNYFAADVEEQAKVVSMVSEGLSGPEPILTLNAAIQKIASIFAIENVAAYVQELESERAKRTDEAAKRFAAEQGAIHDRAAKLTEDDDENEEPGGDRGSGGTEPPPPARGRGRRAPAAVPPSE